MFPQLVLNGLAKAPESTRSDLVGFDGVAHGFVQLTRGICAFLSVSNARQGMNQIQT